jgi:hypothetical protein
MKVLTLSSISSDIIICNREIPLLYVVKGNHKSGNVITYDLWFKTLNDIDDENKEDTTYNFLMIDQFVNDIEEDAPKYKAVIFEKELYNDDKLKEKFPKTSKYLYDSLYRLKQKISLLEEFDDEMSVLDHVINFS